MSNRPPINTTSTQIAHDNFSNFLKAKLKESKISGRKLAGAIGIGKTTICAYSHGSRFPRLDTLAEVFAYFGETEIRIPIKEIKSWEEQEG